MSEEKIADRQVCARQFSHPSRQEAGCIIESREEVTRAFQSEWGRPARHYGCISNEGWLANGKEKGERQ